jgi:hypothetical protein
MSLSGMDMIMGQMSTMAMMGNSTKMIDAIWAIIIMYIIRQSMSWIPHISSWIQSKLDSHLNSVYTKVLPIETNKTKMSSIIYSRSYKEDQGPEPEEFRITDAILNLAARCDNSKYLRSNGRYYMAHDNEVCLEDGLYFKQLSATLGEDQELLSNITVEIYSYTMDLTHLRRCIMKIYEDYIAELENELGEKLYYFEDIPFTIPKTLEGKLRYEVAPKMISYNITPFYTNKSLSNVYGNAMRVVRKRVKFFMENRSWYDKHGIPYTLGFLLHGPPGCGKTSLIKAIANECNRHVFSVKMTSHTTRSQMSNLFFSEDVKINQKGTDRTISIPMKKRLLVFEEIDTMGDVVSRRKGVDEDGALEEEAIDVYQPIASSMNKREQTPDGFPVMMTSIGAAATAMPLSKDDSMAGAPEKSVASEKLDLGILLNLMDGILETPGRILIMTTNRASILDPALIRPGRIDMIVNFQKCTVEEVSEIFTGITGDKLSKDIISKIPDHKYSPAKITQKIFEYHDMPEEGIRELVYAKS